jgi:hypothetical protein
VRAIINKLPYDLPIFEASESFVSKLGRLLKMFTCLDLMVYEGILSVLLICECY